MFTGCPQTVQSNQWLYTRRCRSRRWRWRWWLFSNYCSVEIEKELR